VDGARHDVAVSASRTLHPSLASLIN
jgi:hypothetical protein